MTYVESGSPSDEAKIEVGDVIQEADRKPVGSVEQFKEILKGKKEDKSLLLLMKRKDYTSYLVVNMN